MNKKELSKQRFDAAAPQRAALSRNLRQLKEERKLTQDQLAEMTGLSLNEVARILKETANGRAGKRTRRSPDSAAGPDD